MREELTVPDKEYPLRLWYMEGSRVCTIIDVDERSRKVKVHNYTKDYIAVCKQSGYDILGQTLISGIISLIPDSLLLRSA